MGRRAARQGGLGPDSLGSRLADVHPTRTMDERLHEAEQDAARGGTRRCSRISGKMTRLLDHLAMISPGPIPDPAGLERLAAACWHEFQGGDGGMTGEKLLGRMEEVFWEPPVLSFIVERHGRTVMGSSRATL